MNSNEISPFIILLGLYCIAIMVIGILIHFKQERTPEDYVNAGKSFNRWPLGISISTTYVSNIAILALPTVAFSSNWAYLVGFLGIPISGLIISKYFLEKLLAKGYTSVYLLISEKCGKKISLYAAMFYVFSNIVRVAIILYLASLSIEILLGINTLPILIILSAITITYTTIGGIRSVIWTDVLQGILIVFAIGILFYSAITLIDRPPTEVFALAYKDGGLNLGSLSFSFFKPTILLYFFVSVVDHILAFGANQGIYMRLASARNLQESKKSLLIGTVLTVGFIILLFALGSYLKVGVSQNEILSQSEYVVIAFCQEYLSPLSIAVVLIGLIAAAMSSIDTEINAFSALFYSHVYKEWAYLSTDKNKEKNALYACSGVAGILCMMLALFCIKGSNLMERWFNFDSFFSGSILGIMLLTALVKKNTKKYEIALYLMVLTLVSLWLQFHHLLPPSFRNPFDENLNMSISALSILISVFLVNFYRQLLSKSTRISRN